MVTNEDYHYHRLQPVVPTTPFGLWLLLSATPDVEVPLLAPNILHGQGHARKYPCLQGNTQGTCLYNMSVASPMWTDMTALGRIKPVTLPFAVSKSNSVKQPFFFRMVTYCPEMLLQCSHIRSSPNIQSPRSPQDPTQNQQISSTNRTPPADITSLLLLSSIAKTPCQASGLF